MARLSKVALKAALDALIVNNTSGDIEADEVNTLLTDFIDSFEEEATPASVPSIRNFRYDGEVKSVNPGTTITGSQTFRWDVSEPSLIQGNLTLSQNVPVTGNVVLDSAVNPTAGSFVDTITEVTLTAGQQTDFVLSGTATPGAGGGAFSSTITTLARTLDDYVYVGDAATNVPALPLPGQTNFSFPFAGSRQNLVIPTFAGNRFLMISQKASEPNLRAIEIGGLNQLTAFNRVDDAVKINNEDYDVYVSNSQLIGSTVSGQVVEIVR